MILKPDSAEFMAVTREATRVKKKRFNKLAQFCITTRLVKLVLVDVIIELVNTIFLLL